MTETRSSRIRRKQQRWIYIVGVLFIGDFVFYGYMPSQQRLRSLKEAQTRQERMIETAAAQGKELPALKLRLRNVEKLVEHYEAYVPEDGSLSTFLQEIARIMTEHHLADQVFEPGKEVQSEGVNCIPVRMNCKGSLNEIFGFFRDFQAIDRLVRIEKAVLKNDSGLSGQVAMQTEAVIFYRPQTPQKARTSAVDTSRKGVGNDA